MPSDLERPQGVIYITVFIFITSNTAGKASQNDLQLYIIRDTLSYFVFPVLMNCIFYASFMNEGNSIS